jgi:hypothetical protein
MSQPTPDQVHVDGYLGGQKGGKRKMTDEEKRALEGAVLKRDFSTAERAKLASEGKALPDGSYPIPSGEQLEPAAVLARSGHGQASEAKALIERRAKALGLRNPLQEAQTSKTEGAPVAIDVPLWKSAEREGKVYGVVLAPDREDSQGDMLDAEDIEKACHRFMVESRKADVQHNGVQAGADLIENYIAPVDMQIEGEDVTKGSWVQAWQITDPVVKQEIEEGKRTGFSIGGTGVREPMAA